MTTIRATCPACGEVEMGAQAVLLVVESGATEGIYRFVCPVCEDPVEKRADRKIVMLLLSAGVEVREVSREAAAAEHPSARAIQATFDDGPALEDAPATPEAPPLTLDDLIDLHFALQADDWLGDLIRSAR